MQTNNIRPAEPTDSRWNSLYRVGGLAALLAGLIFRRNLGVEIALFSPQKPPAADTVEQRTLLFAAGQALLVLNRFSSPGAHPGSGGYLSLLLIAAAGLPISIAMLRSQVFGRAAAYLGILANALDLAYCLAYAFLPAVDGSLLAVTFIPAAGLLFMIWHLLVGWRLLQLSCKIAPRVTTADYL